MTSQLNGKSANNQPQQYLTPERQAEQVFLEPFYDRLTGRSFIENKSAIDFCRDLCAEFGFTVKQEASTHRNIYVYCSREGLPDSLRNPKTNPQRKRPSKRCDCRWRVVLYENNGHWEFRKSLNPEAGKHNHELMRPEEIERSWPKEVIDLICHFARLRMTTQDIRVRVQAQFPNIHWNERRFYNRLSEERQKIKQRDTTERTHDLFQLWNKICTLTAGNEELSQFVKHELSTLHRILIQTTQVDDSTLPDPVVFSDDSAEDKEEAGNLDKDTHASNSRQLSKQNATNTLKGYIQVEIPKKTYYIKTYSQRLIQEGQLVRGQRRSRISEDIQMDTPEPTRKVSRKGKGKEGSLLPNKESLPSDHFFQYRHSYSSNRANSTPSTPRINTAPIMRTNPSVHSPSQRQNPQMQATSFVYAYDSNNMSLGSPLSGYVHTPFSNPYHMDTTSNSSAFNQTDMQFQFDHSQSTMVRTSSQKSNTASSSGHTTHNALHSHHMSSKASLSQSVTIQQTTHSNYLNHQQPKPQRAPQTNSDVENNTSVGNTNSQSLYSIHLSPIISNSTADRQNRGPPSQISMYETQESMVSNSPVENQQQTNTYNHNLYMQQASHQHPDSNAIMPMYNQSSQQVNDGSRMNISPSQ